MTRFTKAGEVDGRSKRASGRTEQIATRVTAEFRDQIRAIAERDGILIAEVMEKAVDAYEREQAGFEAAFIYFWERASNSEREAVTRLVNECIGLQAHTS